MHKIHSSTSPTQLSRLFLSAYFLPTNPTTTMMRSRPSHGPFPGETEDDRAERKFWERAWNYSEWVKASALREVEAAVRDERLPAARQMSKKEEAYVKRLDVKEACKAERFNMLMAATEKKLKLEEKNAMLEEKKTMFEEKKVEIAATSEDAKMLTLKM
jgi:hypothetical protein